MHLNDFFRRCLILVFKRLKKCPVLLVGSLQIFPFAVGKTQTTQTLPIFPHPNHQFLETGQPGEPGQRLMKLAVKHQPLIRIAAAIHLVSDL